MRAKKRKRERVVIVCFDLTGGPLKVWLKAVLEPPQDRGS